LTDPPAISVIIPTLNEAVRVRDLLADLAAARGKGLELILTDGGSTDGTADLARPLVRTILLMWRLRLAYALGADPRRLGRHHDP
jgi:glycosyltransferase involved in cell wall biosynthesis